MVKRFKFVGDLFDMKKLVLGACALLLSFALLPAQGYRFWNGKSVESNIRFYSGPFLQTGSNRNHEVFNFSQHGFHLPVLGATLRLSYGLDARLGSNWSLMPGAGLRAQTGSLIGMFGVGGDTDLLTCADAFLTLRYHLDTDHLGIVFGLGPDVSYVLYQNPYYVDADPDHPRNGLKKYKDFDFGIQPSVMFRMGKHFQWGLEAIIGLRNMRIQYPDAEVSGSTYLHSLMLTCGFHF